MIELLIIPVLTCFALVFIHVYFGSQVLKRGVLFIDLALAQWAALGYIIGHLCHIESPILLFLFSFLFTILASLALAFLKKIYKKINLKEAVIGVMYIAASALSVTLISSTGMEGHHIQEMLAGHLLFITQFEFIAALLIYGGVGLIALFCHQSFTNKDSVWWNFVFYSLFGLVVTSSVKLIGILLVFSFLVIPVLSVVTLTKNLKQQLWGGWTFGISGSILGMLLSIYIDIPPSYSVILTLCIMWVTTLTIVCRKRH